MDTHTHAPTHTTFLVNRLRDLWALPPRITVRCRKQAFVLGHPPPPPDLKVIYPPRERWARGRGVGSGKQRLAQRGRCGPETAAPDTQVKLAQTCLRPRGPSKRNPVQAPVKAPALPEPRELSASGPGRAGFLGRQRGTRPGPVGIGAPPGQGARSGCAGESESTEPYSRLNK